MRDLKKWKTLSSTLVFDHRWFKVRQDTVELPNGKVLDDYFVWEGTNIALVVPVTKNNEFVLVRQYKHASGQIMIEFPAGMIDKNESAETAAQRELLEETGYDSKELTFLTKVTDHPTKANYAVSIFLAKDVEYIQPPHLDDTEDIEVLVRPIPEVIDMIRKGEIWVSGSIVGAFLAVETLRK